MITGSGPGPAAGRARLRPTTEVAAAAPAPTRPAPGRAAAGPIPQNDDPVAAVVLVSARLGWSIAGPAAIPVVAALLGIGKNYLKSTIGNSAMGDLRSDLFAHLQRTALALVTATKTGAIQSRLANDVGGVRTVLTDPATTILQNSVTVVWVLSPWCCSPGR